MRDCPQRACHLVLGTELAGSTAKSIIKPGDSQQWVRDGGWSSYCVKVKQKGGQGRSRFGGPHRKDKIMNTKLGIKANMYF